MGRLSQTTRDDSQPSGWLEITHPFHPLRSQSFKILKSKKVCGKDIFSLRDSHGLLHVVPRDWTSLATPSSLADILPAILHFDSLLALCDLIQEINHDDR
jgi:Family of unknown function (DUF5372)